MDKKLKQYMEDNFDFYSLKQAGFFKDIKKSDYEAQAARVVRFFGLESIYHYNNKIESSRVETDTSLTIHYTGSIDKDGKYQEGNGAHLSTIQSGFKCPICECEQEAREDKVYYKAKCKGCKRKLAIAFELSGHIKVWEIEE